MQMERDEQSKNEEQKEAYKKQKEEEFEDLIGGKAKRKSKNEMTLQDIFREQYSKVKEVKLNPKAYINSAMSSLNSQSGFLQRRRQKAMEEHKKPPANDEIKEESKESMNTGADA